MKAVLMKLSHLIPDRMYISLRYRLALGYWPSLRHPKTFNEKLQWIKLCDRKPEYSMMVDKDAVKKYIGEKIGEQYLIPTLGVWNRVEEIDFEKLPERFVLKCTHNSGGLVVCKDKSALDLEGAKKKLRAALEENYYWHSREWPYRSVPPRIIAEKYMENEDGSDLKDYKIQCFHGKADHILVCTDRYSDSGVKYFYFDRNWQFLPYCRQEENASEAAKINPPQKLKEMIEIAEKLSEGIPELRVDLYEIQGNVYFGELTFFSSSGFDRTITEQADRILGEKLVLEDAV